MKKKNRCTANSVPLVVKIQQQRALNKAAVEAVKDVRQTDALERIIYCMIIALNEEYGFGRERLGRVLDKTAALSQQYNRLRRETDNVYADEKLRLRAEEVLKGSISTLYSSERKTK